MFWIVAIALLIAVLGLAALLRRTRRTGLATEFGAPHHPTPAGMSGDATGITLPGRCCRLCGRADGHWSGCLLAPRAAGAPLLRSLRAEE